MIPELRWSVRSPAPDGVALVLPGAAIWSPMPMTWQDLGILRMLPVAKAIAGSDDRIAVARLKYAIGGWNMNGTGAVIDAEWALDEAARRFPGVPVVVVGHSVGGRVALRLGADPRVTGVLALAPWLSGPDPVIGRPGLRALVVHGKRDLLARSALSRRRVADLLALGADASFLAVGGDTHTMLLRWRVWNEVTIGYVRGVLLGAGRGPAPALHTAGLAGILADVLGGPTTAEV